MRFTSAKMAIHYYFNHQWMRPDDDFSKLWVRVQYTAKGGSGATWLSMELGDLVRPLNKLPSKPRAWAMYAFAGEGHYSREQHVKLCAHVISECRKREGIRKPTTNIAKKLIQMAPLALEDQAHREVTGHALYSDSQLCQKLGIQQSNWRKCWKSKYLAMSYALNELSSIALEDVSEKLQAIAET